MKAARGQRLFPGIDAVTPDGAPPNGFSREWSAGPEPGFESRQLWLAVHLSALPLEILPDRGSGACVSAEGEGVRRQVAAVNAAARRAGIVPGMKLSAAHALTRDLRAVQRDSQAEEAALRRIALWAMRFTPLVSPVPPDGLVLEIKGSVKLFGGLETLVSRVGEGLRELGHAGCQAVAPTPLAALLLTRAALPATVTSQQGLRAALGRVPVAHLRLPEAQTRALRAIGIRSIAECLRLPRADFARRFGPEVMARLDQLTGRAPDPRTPVPLPAIFADTLSLPWEVADSDTLLSAAQRLLMALEGYLAARCGATRLLHWKFVHSGGKATAIELGLATARSDAEHMLGLLRERLRNIALQAPVCSLTLRVDQIEAGRSLETDLFSRAYEGSGRKNLRLEKGVRFISGNKPGTFSAPLPAGSESTLVFELIDRLHARLNVRVGRLICVPDHRPECAWQWLAIKDDKSFKNGSALPIDAERPLWLLPKPRPLEKGDRSISPPMLQSIDKCQGENRSVAFFFPERIESGWWDGAEVRRDYHQAVNRHGERLWVFRELHRPAKWYVHGFFS